jgi:hypothetical protein
MSTPRKLAAILAADVAGYSRLTGLDEEGTLKRLRKLRRELINPAVDLPSVSDPMKSFTPGNLRMLARGANAQAGTLHPL